MSSYFPDSIHSKNVIRVQFDLAKYVRRNKLKKELGWIQINWTKALDFTTIKKTLINYIN